MQEQPVDLHEPQKSDIVVEPARLKIRGWSQPGFRWDALAELALIGVWAILVGRAYLDFNPYTWPTGREFGSQVQSHHFWPQLQRCGLCALRNGGVNGGAPALGDVFGSTLHPVVMIPILLWGVVIGTKTAVVGALVMAGLAQWWIAKRLGVGQLPLTN